MLGSVDQGHRGSSLLDCLVQVPGQPGDPAQVRHEPGRDRRPPGPSVQLDSLLDHRSGRRPVSCCERDERAFGHAPLQEIEVVGGSAQRIQLVDDDSEALDLPRVGVDGLEPVEREQQARAITARPRERHSPPPLSQRTVELEAVRRDHRSAREQVHLRDHVPDLSRQAQAGIEVRFDRGERPPSPTRTSPASSRRTWTSTARKPWLRLRSRAWVRSPRASGNPPSKTRIRPRASRTPACADGSAVRSAAFKPRPSTSSASARAKAAAARSPATNQSAAAPDQSPRASR